MKKIKIYQIYHDKESYNRCTKNNPDIIPLNVSKMKDLPSQLAECRAFYKAVKYIGMSKGYVGFTTYKHDQKFPDCVRINDISIDLIERGFRDDQVKLIAFDPTKDIFKHMDEYFPGMSEFIITWMREEMGLKDNPRWMSKMKHYPLCNCFIMKSSEFREYFKFFDKFVNYITDTQGIDNYLLTIPVSNTSRGWGYFCEMLLSFYLMFKYKNNFKIAHINKRWLCNEL